MYKFSKKSLDTLSTIYGPLEALVHSVLSLSPYDLGIPPTGGRRTPEEQNELFNKGWSKLDGYSKKSYHQSGMAVDIVVYEDGKKSYSCLDKYEEISILFMENFESLRELGVFPNTSYLRWGFDWDKDGVRGDRDPDERFYDAPHFELRNI